MKSMKEVYRSLKKHDHENKLSLINENVIVLKVNDNSSITALDNYVRIVQNDKEITHFHPDDFKEIYKY